MNQDKTYKTKKKLSASAGIFALLIISLLAYALFDENGFLKVLQMDRKINKLKSQINHVDRGNKLKRETAKQLKQDSKLIENIARNELGMIKKEKNED